MTQKWSKTERNQTDFPFVWLTNLWLSEREWGGKRDTWKHVARSVTGVRRSVGSKGHVSFNLLLRKRIITAWSSALCFVGSLTKFQTQPNYKWDPLWVVHEPKVAKNNERRRKLTTSKTSFAKKRFRIQSHVTVGGEKKKVYCKTDVQRQTGALLPSMWRWKTHKVHIKPEWNAYSPVMVQNISCVAGGKNGFLKRVFVWVF